MTEQKYPHLFSPIRLGNTVFRNRLFVSPTGANNLTADRRYTTDTCAYYERKALGGAAAVAVGEGFNIHRPMCSPTEYVRAISSFVNFTSAISQHGAVPVAEINHMGMVAMNGPGEPLYGPVECLNSRGEPVLPMTEEAIETVIKNFAESASRAKAAGFGMIHIHGGHGWLISQFMSPVINTRKDKWGGSLENRMRFPLAVIEAIRKAVGPGFPLEFRLSGSECNPNGYDIDEGIRFAEHLDGKIDLLHVSAGCHEVEETFFITHPSMFMPDGCNVGYAEAIKKRIKTPVATVGGHTDPELMEEILKSGKADVIEAARAFIVDPYLPAKAKSGNEDDIDRCMRCFQCFSIHQTKGQMYCALNPVSGHEHELKEYIGQIQKKKVLVVGGGIAGMQAALTAKRIGHEVILCEKNDKLGGILRCEEKVSFKRRLGEYMDRQARRLGREGVDVRLGTNVTPELARSIGADVIIAALGARPVKPPIPGIDGPSVMSAEEAYLDCDKVGKKAVIIGGGFVGTELAIYLSMEGRDVSVLEMLPKFDYGDNHHHGRGVGFKMKELGVKTYLNTKASEITENGVKAETPEGEKFFDADTVIYAAGLSPLWDEADTLRFAADDFIQIGDCLAAKNLMAANTAGFFAARDIGRSEFKF